MPRFEKRGPRQLRNGLFIQSDLNKVNFRPPVPDFQVIV